MGAELTDPFKACCCANQMKIDNAVTMGNNTNYHFEDYLHANRDWIVRIQAAWRGKVQRMRYQKRRSEFRKAQRHFLVQDQLETVSHRRVIELHILFHANEAELNEQLEQKTHRYRTTGASYTGQWLGGFRHGQGKMQLREGATYEGTWYLGRAQGFGIFTEVKGETYEGEWADDQHHGKGIWTHVNFLRFEGQFKKGVMEGVGTERHLDGTFFMGNFSANKRNGYGVQWYPNGCQYSGNYVNGIIEGFGTYRWKNGNEFSGDWKNQKIYGFGVQDYPNHHRYEGFYKLDKRHGYGIYMASNQHTYSGAWLDNKMNGYGCLFNTKNELKYGLWKNGEKLCKVNHEQATDIQDGTLDLSTSTHIQTMLGEDKLTFWQEVGVLTNKFEPFDNFATEQAKFELNKCTQGERASALTSRLSELEINADQQAQ